MGSAASLLGDGCIPRFEKVYAKLVGCCDKLVACANVPWAKERGNVMIAVAICDDNEKQLETISALLAEYQALRPRMCLGQRFQRHNQRVLVVIGIIALAEAHLDKAELAIKRLRHGV